MFNFEPGLPHLHFMETRKPKLSFDAALDYSEWRSKHRAKFLELIGDAPEDCAPGVTDRIGFMPLTHGLFLISCRGGDSF